MKFKYIIIIIIVLVIVTLAIVFTPYFIDKYNMYIHSKDKIPKTLNLYVNNSKVGEAILSINLFRYTKYPDSRIVCSEF